MTLTSETLTKAMRAKLVIPLTPMQSDIAEAIRVNHLALAIMPGVRPAITFEAYFQALFGQKLDGSKINRRAKA